jgi:hypothetical protein
LSVLWRHRCVGGVGGVVGEVAQHARRDLLQRLAVTSAELRLRLRGSRAMDPSKIERMKKAIEELKAGDAFRTEPKHDGDMPLGTHIVLKNLASRPDLNGAMGTIVGSCTRAPGAAAVRYPVKLDSTEVISIKVTNMSMFGFPAEPPSPDAWRPIAGAGIGSIKKSQQDARPTTRRSTTTSAPTSGRRTRSAPR